jgi:small conductance mechanosensitive channel
MTVPRIQAAAPLTDIGTWLRGSGLEIVLLVVGGLLLARFATWSGRKITERIDAAATDEDTRAPAFSRYARSCGNDR